MSLELLKTIAMLCAINGSGEAPINIETKQIECQSFYVDCLKKSKKELFECVHDRGKVFEALKQYKDKLESGK